MLKIKSQQKYNNSISTSSKPIIPHLFKYQSQVNANPSKNSLNNPCDPNSNTKTFNNSVKTHEI